MARIAGRWFSYRTLRTLNHLAYSFIIVGTCYVAFQLLLLWTQEFSATGSVSPLLR
jgi:hypothetical protein